MVINYNKLNETDQGVIMCFAKTGAQITDNSSFCSNCGKSSTWTETAKSVIEIAKPQKVAYVIKMLYFILAIDLINVCLPEFF